MKTNQEEKVMKKEVVDFFYKVNSINDGARTRVDSNGKDLLLFIFYPGSEDGNDYKGKNAMEILGMIAKDSTEEDEKEIVSLTIAFLETNTDIDFTIESYDYNDKKIGILGVNCSDFNFLAIVLKDCNIFHPDFIEESDEKNYYSVACWGECSNTGVILLTNKEAAALNHFTNPNNWELTKIEEYSGTFKIDIANPHPADSDFATIVNPWL